MLFRHGLAQFPPLARLMILIGLVLVLWFVFASLCLLAIAAFTELDVLNNTTALYDFDNPAAVRSLKFFQFVSSLGMFVLPPVVLAALICGKPMQWLALRNRFKPAQLVFAVVLIVISLPLINGMAALNNAISFPDSIAWLEDWMRNQEASMAELTKGLLTMNSTAALLANLVVIALLPALGEELLFRGAVQRIFISWIRNPHVAIWLTGAIFSFIHFQFLGFLPRMVLGALLGYLVYWTGSLWPSIAAHFANNGFAVWMAWMQQRGQLPEGTDEVGSDQSQWPYWVVSGVLVVAMLYNLYRNRNPHYANTVLAASDEPQPPAPY